MQINLDDCNAFAERHPKWDCVSVSHSVTGSKSKIGFHHLSIHPSAQPSTCPFVCHILWQFCQYINSNVKWNGQLALLLITFFGTDKVNDNGTIRRTYSPENKRIDGETFIYLTNNSFGLNMSVSVHPSVSQSVCPH